MSDGGARGSGRDRRRHVRGSFLPTFPPLAPARPESHMSRGQVDPSRRAPADQLGCVAPSHQLEHVAHRGEYGDKLFFITTVQLLCTSMNLTVSLLPLER
jgi:hypothetical protein